MIFRLHNASCILHSNAFFLDRWLQEGPFTAISNQESTLIRGTCQTWGQLLYCTRRIVNRGKDSWGVACTPTTLPGVIITVLMYRLKPFLDDLFTARKLRRRPGSSLLLGAPFIQPLLGVVLRSFIN